MIALMTAKVAKPTQSSRRTPRILMMTSSHRRRVDTAYAAPSLSRATPTALPMQQVVYLVDGCPVAPATLRARQKRRRLARRMATALVLRAR